MTPNPVVSARKVREAVAMSLGISPVAFRRFNDSRERVSSEDDGGGAQSSGVVVRGNVLSLTGPFVADDDPCAGFFGEAVVSAMAVQEALDGLSGEIFLDINSPGGVLDTGTAIGGAVDDYREKDGNRVTARVRAMAASAATIPMVRADEVLVDALGAVMIHYPLVMVIGNATDLREAADRLDNYEQAMEKMYVQRRDMTLDNVRSAMGEETFFVGDQAVDIRLADGLMAVPTGAADAAGDSGDESTEEDPMVVMTANLPQRQFNRFLAERLGV